MKNLTILLLCLLSLTVTAQNQITKEIKELKAKGHFKDKPYEPFRLSNVVRSDQSVNKSLYKIGDKLTCLVWSSAPQTTTKCWIDGTAEIIIK
jgi:hypothetical protein